jgi:hypothetical protein
MSVQDTSWQAKPACSRGDSVSVTVKAAHSLGLRVEIPSQATSLPPRAQGDRLCQPCWPLRPAGDHDRGDRRPTTCTRAGSAGFKR